VQAVRPLDDVDRTLRRLLFALVLVSLGGVALAVWLGLLVARAALTPVKQLTDAAEHVARTRDLSRRIRADRTDELSRLGASFNTMLEALSSSQQAQRQLVADASHELRTPLTSLRTNIEVLSSDALPPEDRERLLADVVAQLGELTLLVSDLVDLARGDEPAAVPEDVRLDLLVADAVERARRHAPDKTFFTDLEPSLVEGVPGRLDRAVANLIDNAAKWSPPGGQIEVSVSGGEVSVRDHGPGIADSDLPHVFDRFYRAPAARGLPGSGLGLAIVRQVAQSHGGTVTAERANGGGARMRLTLPVAE
jgi:two-component system, OmpR family, sensor histidine kinase MprB